MKATLLSIPLALVACAGPPLLTHGADQVRGRVEGRLIATYAAGRETTRLPLPSGELTVDVVEVAVDSRARTIEAIVEWHNRSDEALRVAVADMRLDYCGEPHAAKLPLDVEMPPLRPRVRQRTVLRFELSEAPVAGIYQLHVRRVTPIDRSLDLAVKVPGPLR